MCKNRGSLFLYDRVNESGETTEQWLGTGGAAYPLAGLPHMTEEHLLTLFDITAKQREAMHFAHTQLTGSRINHGDADDSEVRLDDLDLTLGYNGRRIRPYLTSSGPEFMDCAYLAPLSDAGEWLSIYERTTPNGQVYFAAKAGLLLLGVIMPVRELEEQFAEQLETLAKGLRAAIDAKQDSAGDEQIEI